jgi:hypothetical protein
VYTKEIREPSKTLTVATFDHHYIAEESELNLPVDFYKGS